ncbi:5-formyltetrahydrofolate cyclo-ligase [Romboutsia hominis]|uniref:5-formyltetrahydrofolate cyclo-ligase n=1 Tax=Romboutsia hominis TaxID=1507512 RepID=UPI002FE6F7AE
MREPKPECSPEVEVKDIDVVIVPAVAYDKDCYRLGYGGGFYDRFIERLREDAITVGIAFDLQIFDSVPKEDHDAQLDYIITESQILTPNKF